LHLRAELTIKKPNPKWGPGFSEEKIPSM
jgi:hypothetical protein